jgi:hypothetical protein
MNMIKTLLPGGMIGDSAELYSDNEVLMCIADNGIQPVIKVERIKQKVVRHMKNRPNAHRAVIQMAGPNEDDQINRYGQCMWGAFNMAPDIDNLGELTEAEFVHCSKRDSCPYSGIICKNLNISKAEDRVIPLVLWSDRIIGAMLNLSEFTVKTHFKNIKKKLGLQTKGEVIDWAKDNGIKLCK